MPAKKKAKKIAKKTAPKSAGKPAPKTDSGSDEKLAAALERIEARLASLESRKENPPAGEDLAAALRPAIDVYRESMRARREQQMQTPWVMAGLVAILAFTVAVLGVNDVLSGGTVAVLLTGSVGYALFQLQKALR